MKVCISSLRAIGWQDRYYWHSTGRRQREAWLQSIIEQRPLPPPRQGIIERVAEAIARLQTEAAIQARSNTVILQYTLFYKNELDAILGFYHG